MGIIIRKAVDVKIPDGVEIKCWRRKVTVIGPRGKLWKDFKHSRITIRHNGAEANTLTVEKNFDRKKRCAVVQSVASHIKNMIVGVTKGFRYKMKLVYAHFPINATVLDDGQAHSERRQDHRAAQHEGRAVDRGQRHRERVRHRSLGLA